jgi:hypothetical protein
VVEVEGAGGSAEFRVPIAEFRVPGARCRVWLLAGVVGASTRLLPCAVRMVRGLVAEVAGRVPSAECRVPGAGYRGFLFPPARLYGRAARRRFSASNRDKISWSSSGYSHP